MVLSVAAVWWTSVRNPICWPVGVASVMVYAWIFLQSRLYSDALLQLVYAVLCGYGWWHWLRSRQGDGRPGAAAPSTDGRPPVARPRVSDLAAALGVGAAGALALGGFMAHYTDAALPWLDASLAAFSLVAQYWMARLYRANWVLWIVVDAVYVGLYLNRALLLTAALYAAFLGLAAYGWWKWQPAEKLNADAR